jgi:beta-glucosidase
MKIALIGKMARQPIVGGGGSGQVFPDHVVSPYESLLTALNMADQIQPLSVNCTIHAHKNVGYEQASCVSFSSPTEEECSRRCVGFNGCEQWTFVGGEKHGHCIFAPTQKGLKPMPGAVSGQCIKTQPTPEWQCNSDNVCVATTDGTDVELAKSLASEADVAILAIGTSSGEGSDRESLSFAQTKHSCQLMPEADQDDLVTAIAAVAKSTVVAMVCPGACLTPWRASVDAILHSFLPGESYGLGLVDVLLGKVNPSARMPLTMPNEENEVGFTEEQYPGVNKVATYSEEMLIDYRWYTANEVKPAFAFGHGLSYTTFSYGDLKFTQGNSRELQVQVQNTGNVPGSEVVQMYVTFPESAQTPPLQLKGFVKTEILQPGSFQKVTFEIRDRDISVYDVDTAAFKIVQGQFLLKVGSASDDIKVTTTFESN